MSKYSRRKDRKTRKAKNKAKNQELALVKLDKNGTEDSEPYELPELDLPESFKELSGKEQLLLQMLSYKRPGGTKTEKAWIKKFITEPVEAAGHTIHEDWMGNHYVHIGDPEKHKTLFSGHTDTVHIKEGTQEIDYDPVSGMCGLQKPEVKPKPKPQTDFTNGWKNVWGAKDGSTDPTGATIATSARLALIWDTKDQNWFCKDNGKHYKSYREYEQDVGLPDSYTTRYQNNGYYDSYCDDYYTDSYSGYGAYNRECLGADDGTGVFIMVQMILEGVEGTYIFHREEETGGQGSNHIAQTQNDKNHKKNKSGTGKFKNQDPMGINELYDHAIDLTIYHRAIAFDRKGTADIITDQFGKCASAEFARVLAYRLNVAMGITIGTKAAWHGCSGVFTDTANYTSHISECTNLSVGYYNQHGSNEEQDIPFAIDLLEACCEIDWRTLPTERALKDQTTDWSWADDDHVDVTGNKRLSTTIDYDVDDHHRDTPYQILPEGGFVSYDEALDTVMEFPEAIAELLLLWWVSGDDDNLAHDEEEPADPVG